MKNEKKNSFSKLQNFSENNWLIHYDMHGRSKSYMWYNFMDGWNLE